MKYFTNLVSTFSFKVVFEVFCIAAIAVFGTLYANTRYQVASQSKVINNWIPLTSRVEKLHALRVKEKQETEQIESLQNDLVATDSGITTLEGEIEILLNK